MKDNRFYGRMNSLNKEELFDILLNYKEYEAEAVDAAVQVCKEKKLVLEFRELAEKKQQGIQNEQPNELEYSQDLSKINLKNRISFNTGSSSQMNFEAQLIKNNINYYKSEGYNVESLVMNYYFSDEDYDMAKALASE